MMAENEKKRSILGRVLFAIGCLWFLADLVPLGASPVSMLFGLLDPDMRFTVHHFDFYRYSLRLEFPVAAAVAVAGLFLMRRARRPLSLLYCATVVACACAAVFFIGSVHGWFRHRHF